MQLRVAGKFKISNSSSRNRSSILTTKENSQQFQISRPEAKSLKVVTGGSSEEGILQIFEITCEL